MEWWDEIVLPMIRRVWINVATRLGFQQTTGLRKLRKEVRTCEYEDVHVMWEMLRKADSDIPPAGRRARIQLCTRRASEGAWSTAALASEWTRRGASPLNLCFLCCSF
uniref:Uncharacterized protein n=1 Tax=Ananas comosus var. bracteatus TaxID=296719 RepID=A0A6V7QES2_ANACO|nr:unnamed protein product [Ananas comosus var. bracteatus]